MALLLGILVGQAVVLVMGPLAEWEQVIKGMLVDFGPHQEATMAEVVAAVQAQLD